MSLERSPTGIAHLPADTASADAENDPQRSCRHDRSRRTHGFASDHPLRSRGIGADSFGASRLARHRLIPRINLVPRPEPLDRRAPSAGRQGQETWNSGRDGHWAFQIGRTLDLAGGTGEPDDEILKTTLPKVNRKIQPASFFVELI